MKTRQELEREFAQGHIADVIDDTDNNTRIRRIFPEQVSSFLLREQPYASISTTGTVSLLESDLPRAIFTGPCLIPKQDLSSLLDAALHQLKNKARYEQYFKQLDSVVSKLPTLQTIFNLGAYIDNDKSAPMVIVVIIETLEYTKLLLLNDAILFREYGQKVLARMTSLANRHESLIRRIHYKRGLRSTLQFVYTHDDTFSELVNSELRDILPRDRDLRNSRYPVDLSSEIPGGLSVEFYYTHRFAEKTSHFLFGLTDAIIVMCENYRNFLPIISAYSLPTDFFSIGRVCNWLGLLPPPSVDGKRDMHLGIPLYLGLNTDVELQLENITNRYILLTYLLFLSSWDDLQNPDFLGLMKATYSNRELLPIIRIELLERLGLVYQPRILKEEC